ncbi:MAG: polysaccharide pyruvyl transferase family protein [Candidatus Sedimenticola sp. (ex Thyasira tokunagai)]
MLPVKEDGTKSAKNNKVKRALVIAPSGWWGSVGDDALIRSTSTALRENGFEVFVLVNREHHKWQNALQQCGVSIICPSMIFTPQGIKMLLMIDDVYVIGADIMDGGYDTKAITKRFTLAKILRMFGKSIFVISFSFNKKPKKEVLQACKMLGKDAKYKVRDPRSLDRFKEATGLSAECVADVGFLTRAKNSSSIADFKSWADHKRKKGFTLLLVNTSIGPFRSNPRTSHYSPDEVVDAIAVVLKELKRLHLPQLAIGIVPHDFRNSNKAWSDMALAEALHVRLKPDMDNDIQIVPTPFDSPEMCAMAASSDLVITGRMHLAIISITAGVVPVSFTYQDKFEGMYEHVFDKSDKLMQPTDLLFDDPKAIADQFKQILDAREGLCMEIAASRNQIIAKAMRNFTL